LVGICIRLTFLGCASARRAAQRPAAPRRGVVRAATSRSRRAGCCVTLRSHAIGIDPPLRDTAGYTADRRG